MSRRRVSDDEIPAPRDRKSRASAAPVEKLIEQRRLIEEWLAKLAAGGADGMPSHVVERVRNDYTARLTAITRELGEHGDDVRNRLAEAEKRRAQLEKEQAARRDELAELKLRRQVGEIEEGKFREEQRELKDTIDDLTKDLAATLREIDRFEDILDTMSAADEDDEEEEEEEEEVPPKAPARAVVKAEAPPPPPPPPPPPSPPAKPAAPAAPAAPGAATPGKDELSFLRSLTTQQAAIKPPSGSPPAAKAPQPPPQQKKEEEKVEIPQPIDPTKPRERPSMVTKAVPENEKTLTCQECGAKNLPTEWYCEKCGAELTTF